MTIVGLNGILANRCQQILTNKFQHDSNNDRVCGRYNKLACGVDDLQISDLGALPCNNINTYGGAHSKDPHISKRRIQFINPGEVGVYITPITIGFMLEC